HELRADGDAPLGLAVLPRVAEVRDHGRDALRARAAEAVDHDQQLHQVFVHRRAGRLNHVDVRAADVLEDLHGDLAVGEPVDLDLARIEPQELADLVPEHRVRAARKDQQALLHARFLPRFGPAFFSETFSIFGGSALAGTPTRTVSSGISPFTTT